MPNATVTSMLQSLATVTVDTTATDNYQDEIIFEIARGGFKNVLMQTGTAFIHASSGVVTYTLASPARTILLLCYDKRQLATAKKDEAWMLDAAWRTSPQATPIAYTLDPEDRTQFALVPPPQETGDAPGGDPTGTTFVERNITVVYTKTDLTIATGAYRDTLLPIAFEALSRELARDSDHQDKLASGVASNMAGFLFAMAFPETIVPGIKSGAR